MSGTIVLTVLIVVVGAVFTLLIKYGLSDDSFTELQEAKDRLKEADAQIKTEKNRFERQFASAEEMIILVNRTRETLEKEIQLLKTEKDGVAKQLEEQYCIYLEIVRKNTDTTKELRKLKKREANTVAGLNLYKKEYGIWVKECLDKCTIIEKQKHQLARQENIIETIKDVLGGTGNKEQNTNNKKRVNPLLGLDAAAIGYPTKEMLLASQIIAGNHTLESMRKGNREQKSKQGDGKCQ